MKRAILVVGAPRSGTSIVAHVINRLGVNFGDQKRFIDSEKNKHNPIFFELLELNAINDEIFSRFSKKWSEFNWYPLESDFTESVISFFEVRIKRFIESEFGRAELIGLKDPRFCFTLPIWSAVLERIGYKIDFVFTGRNPNEIFASNSIVNKTFSEARSFRITVESILVASYLLKGNQVVHVNYESLLVKPKFEVKLLCERLFLEPSLVDFACSVIEPDLNHQLSISEKIFFRYFEGMSGLCFDLEIEYERFREVALALTSERDERIATLGQDVSERDSQIGKLNQSIEDLGCQVTTLEQVVGDRDQSLADREGQISHLDQRVTAYDEQIATLGQDISERDSQIGKLNQSIEGLGCQVTTLEQVVGDRDQSLADREGQISHLEGQRNILNAEIFRLNAESARFGAKIGRGITQLRYRVAPVGTRRGTFVTLVGKFLSKLISFGVREAFRACYRYLSFQLRLKTNPEEVASQSFINRDGSSEIKADHPQLTAWINAHELSRDQLAAQCLEADKFTYTPLISVIIPVFRVPQDVLFETLACLREQSYSNWQACIVWADPEDVTGWKWLQKTIGPDKRFKIKFLEKNGGISANSNAAFELVDGEFVALLDHDDTLAPWAFYEVAKLLQSSPHLDFIYSDKDSITADGHIRLNALFKPGWSPEMLHSVNYLTHLNIMRTDLVREIGGWDSETDGAQDWDIFFRITEKTQHIARIPSILYHWRILPTSTATGLQAKPYAAKGQLITQQNYFKRKGLPATVLPTPEGLFHVKWPEIQGATDIVVYQTGSLEQLVNVLDILRVGKQDIIGNIYVVHSTPQNESLQDFIHVGGDRFVLVPCDVITWRDALRAIGVSSGDQTVLLVDGGAAGLSEDLAQELTGWVAHHPDIAWASAIALNSDDTVYEAGRVVATDYRSAPMFNSSALFSFGWFGGPLWYRNAQAVSPYAVAMKKHDIYDVLDGLNENEARFSEFCLALTAKGQRGIVNPFAKVYFDQAPELHWPNDGFLYHEDPYFNPAFDKVSPLNLCSEEV